MRSFSATVEPESPFPLPPDATLVRNFSGDYRSTSRTPLVYAPQFGLGIGGWGLGGWGIGGWGWGGLGTGAWGWGNPGWWGGGWNPYRVPWSNPVWGPYPPRVGAFFNVADSLYRPWWQYPYHHRPGWASNYLPYYGSGTTSFYRPWYTYPPNVAHPYFGLNGTAANPGIGYWSLHNGVWAPWGYGTPYVAPQVVPLIDPLDEPYAGCFYW